MLKFQFSLNFNICQSYLFFCYLCFVDIKNIIPYVLAIVLGLLLARECNRDKTPKTITRTVTVKVPEIIRQFDTIYKPIPKVVRETDTIILKEFLSASDSLKIAMYINATKEREYLETFEDSIQKIDVFTKVRGELLSQTASYKIFERSIRQTDTVRLKGERNFYLLPQVGFNNNAAQIKSSLSFLYQDRKNRLYTIGYDSDGFILIGYGLKW